MSPFSVYLKKLRTERNLRQATLSAMLNRGQSYISRLETGAAPLPPQSILTKLSAKLQLTSEETQALQTTWATSAKQLTIPRAARPAEFELAHKFVEQLGTLTDKQIQVIAMALALIPIEG